MRATRVIKPGAVLSRTTPVTGNRDDELVGWKTCATVADATTPNA